jgi:two-component system, NarL family, nitrate/nitrite response regulator NarL
MLVAMPAALRLVLVAPDPLVREALSRRLGAVAGVVVVDTLRADAEMRTPLRNAGADVVLWDVPGPDAELPDVVPRGTLVLALVSGAAEGRTARAAGALGAVRRDGEAERIVAAARAVAAGLMVLDPEVDGLVSGPSEGPPAEALTPREREVLQLLATGLTNHAIARRLGITEHTAKFHVNSILGKLGASTRTEAIVQAARLGLVLL